MASGQQLSPAVIAIEIDAKRLIASNTLKSTKLDLTKVAPYAESAQININDIGKVSAMSSVPQGPDALKAMNGKMDGKKAPFSFLAKLELTDGAKAKGMFDKLSASLDRVVVDGKEYYRNKNGGSGAENFVMHMPTGDTVLAGTDDYVESSSANLFSGTLQNSWNRLPAQTVRVAWDLAAMRHIFQQSKEQNAADPNQVMLLSFLENLDALRMAMDLDSPSLLSLVLTGKDDQTATAMKAQIDGLITVAQAQGKQMVGQLPPKTQPVVSALLDALKTTRDGNDIGLTLPRPAGFEDAAAELAQMFAPPRMLVN